MSAETKAPNVTDAMVEAAARVLVSHMCDSDWAELSALGITKAHWLPLARRALTAALPHAPNAVDPNVVAEIVDVFGDYIRTRGYTFHQTSPDTLAMTEAVRDILGTRAPTVVRAEDVTLVNHFEQESQKVGVIIYREERVSTKDQEDYHAARNALLARLAEVRSAAPGQECRRYEPVARYAMMEALGENMPAQDTATKMGDYQWLVALRDKKQRAIEGPEALATLATTDDERRQWETSAAELREDVGRLDRIISMIATPAFAPVDLAEFDKDPSRGFWDGMGTEGIAAPASAPGGEPKVHGVTWLLLRDGCVLLERCEKKARVLGVGEWFVPGGKLERNETDWSCLSREIAEEWHGVRLTGFTPLPIVEGSSVPPGPRGTFLMRPFIVTVDGDVPERSSEGTPLRWVSVEEALESPVVQVRMMVAAALHKMEAPHV